MYIKPRQIQNNGYLQGGRSSEAGRGWAEVD